MISFSGLLNETYNVIPKSTKDIELNDELARFDQPTLLAIYNRVQELTNNKVSDPIALDPGKPKSIKILRALSDDIDLRAIGREFPKYSIVFGDGSRGGRGANNTGLLFEKEVLNDLELYIQEGVSAKFKYPDMMAQLHAAFLGKAQKINAQLVGGENNKRPLTMSAKGMFFGDGSVNIGRKVADIVVNCDGVPYYLSLKYGSTVTFFNAGIKKYFTATQFKNGKFTDSTARAMLEMLGLDEQRFIHTFMNYAAPDDAEERHDKDIIDVTSLYRNENSELIRMLASGIGTGYYLVHKKGKKTKVAYMGFQNLREALKVRTAKIVYPATGAAKRIDIFILTNLFKFKINIRSKQGTLLPTHIMCDYTDV